MKERSRFELPPELEKKNRRAIRLEWATIGWMSSIIAVMYMTMGGSQAMRAALLEDLLSLVPPIAFLVASRFRSREPSQAFPYGQHRSITIAFLAASIALLSLGSLALFESATKLIRQEHPSIGLIEVFGRDVWLGWLMLGALAYSAIPPVILGRMKLPLARDLHDKALHADADMNKADWLTALAGIAGVVGVAVGWWWADAAAALVISFEIVRDGVKNLKRAVEDLMDHEPRTVDGKKHDLPDRLRKRIEAEEWVSRAEVRLREEGHVFSGELFVEPRPGTPDLLAKIERLTDEAHAFDWRMYDVVVMPLEPGSLDES
jgi:cation diffusion facilitator family transporter